MSASEPDTPKIDVTTQTSTETARKPVSASTNQPNILIIVADDLGWADLGFRGSDIQTPNIDRLAAQGIHLERFYVMPICTPTRSALMTARDPMKLGSAYAGFQPWQNGGVAPQERFMPQDFQSAGYQTAMIGKWHLGHTTEPLVPNSRGFDHFFGHLNTQVDYYNYTVASGYDLQENGTSVQRDGTYATDVHGDETVRYITDIRDPDKPFFAYVPFLAPHSPMQAPEALKAKYPDRKDRPFTQKTYAAMVDSLDHNVGKIMDALDAQGIADNTIVLFFSDNGGLAAFGADNSPYRGGKLETFEGGVRVGGILRWPAQIEAGQASDAVVSVLDLYPSLAAAAGVDMSVEKPIDGQNRWAEMSGKSSEIRDGDLYFASNSPMFNRYHVSVMEARWKLVQIIDHQQTSTDVETYLFDIIEDPTETNNLADAHPDEVARLADKIRVWRAQHPINGVRVALAPHPGWRAPLDYAESVMPSSELQTGQFDSYVKGMRAQILQQRHGDKGKIVYD
ncbi:MAG: arylsulfatase [Hellea sp.]|nr:arylsulfatase [Hellea sp.]